MKNKKLSSLSGIILMIAFSIFSFYRSLNSGNNWKIAAAFSGLIIFSVMYIVLYRKIRKQQID